MGLIWYLQKKMPTEFVKQRRVGDCCNGLIKSLGMRSVELTQSVKDQGNGKGTSGLEDLKAVTLERKRVKGFCS